MRISHNMIYSQAVREMNSQLTKIMHYNEQNANQKSINRPSDDPGGMARVLDLSSQVAKLTQYQENIDTATGWLDLADSTLQQVTDISTRLQELCEQAATSTLDADQREMLADEARELFNQLITLANTEYAGDSLFAGTVLDGSAYVEGLAATVRDGDTGTASVLEVTGDAESTIYVEFAQSGTVGVDELEYRYTTDGGLNWETATLAAGDTTLELGTARCVMETGSEVTATAEAGAGDGTALWIRPAAYYQGDTEEDVATLHYGTSPVSADSEGVFDSAVIVRVDDDAVLGGSIEYSYSTDGEATWVEGNETTDDTFTVPGGHVSLASNGGSALAGGDQFVIQPYTADLDVSIGPSSSLTINHVGTEIFGGLYTPVGQGYAEAALPDNPGANLFEAAGNLVAFLETNNQDGIGDLLETLDTAQNQVSLTLGVIGGRQSRLEFADAGVALTIETIEANISSIEDADVAELTTNLTQAQYVYQAILETSSQIMGMSLLSYI